MNEHQTSVKTNAPAPTEASLVVAGELVTPSDLPVRIQTQAPYSMETREPKGIMLFLKDKAKALRRFIRKYSLLISFLGFILHEFIMPLAVEVAKNAIC